MKAHNNQGRLYKTLIAAAVAGAFAQAQAQESADVAALTRPDSWLGAGIGVSSGGTRDRSLFGQYNGLRDHSTNVLLDFEYVKRDDATGFWTIGRGRNLGLDNRELGITVQKQGDWRFSADYNQITRHDPRTINSSLQGAGTTTPVVTLLGTPGAGSDINLEMKRKSFNLAGDKWIFPNLQAELNFKTEDKSGARIWGRGYDCASYVCLGQVPTTNTGAATTRQRWAILLLPEPVSSNIKQIDGRLTYTTDKLLLTAGYYGSFYTDNNGNLTATVPGTLNNAIGVPSPLSGAAAGGTSLQNVLQLPMALWPDNQAHQLYASGSYRFSPIVQSTFKVAYTRATQGEDFGAMGLTNAPAGRSNLGGVLNTTLGQFGITARPTTKLSLLANVRYEKKDDKTPIALYNIENTATWNNSHISHTKTGGKAEASYQLPANIRGTVGIDYDQIKRDLPPVDVQIAGLSALRQKTEEITYRGELRRSVSETVTGSVGLSHAKRTGSDWYNLSTTFLTYGNTYPASTIFTRAGIFPYMFTDRTRDKVKGTIDWVPTEKLSIQFLAEDGTDRYNPPSDMGLRDGSNRIYSVDASYAISEAWKISAYGSRGEQAFRMGQGNSGYLADITDKNTAFGLGLTGKPTGVLEVGGKLAYVRDVSTYRLTTDPSPVLGGTVTAASVANNVAQAAVGLPDVTFREIRLNLFAKYAIDKKSDVRLDLVHVSSKLSEWTWSNPATGQPFTYSDNTTVSINPNQHVTFIGATYIYKF